MSKEKRRKAKAPEYGRKPSPVLYAVVAGLLKLPAKLLLGLKPKIDPKIYEAEGPVVVISNHPSFFDPFVAAVALYPMKINFLAANSYFNNFILRWLLKNVGAIPKIQFRPDPVAMKAMIRVIRRDGVLGIFPEGTRSIVGKRMPVEDTFAKFIGKVKPNLVMVKQSGAYMTWPRWSQSGIRRGKVILEAKFLLTKEEIAQLTTEELNAIIQENMQFDDYSFAIEHGLKYKSRKPAKGLHNILYRCPKCDQLWTMQTGARELYCTSCSNKALMDDYGLLKAADEDSVIFRTPSEWNDWQLERLRSFLKTQGDKDVLVESDVKIFKSEKEGPFNKYAQGKIVFFKDGFIFKGKSLIDGTDLEMTFPIKSIWGISSMYGKYFDLIDERDTYRLHPEIPGQTLTYSHILDIIRTAPSGDENPEEALQ